MVARLGGVALALFFCLGTDFAHAQGRADSVRLVSVSHRAYPPLRLRVAPRVHLARDCSVRYVQEWRPSGTVIVPRMRCWWVRN